MYILPGFSKVAQLQNISLSRTPPPPSLCKQPSDMEIQFQTFILALGSLNMSIRQWFKVFWVYVLSISLFLPLLSYQIFLNSPKILQKKLNSPSPPPRAQMPFYTSMLTGDDTCLKRWTKGLKWEHCCAPCQVTWSLNEKVKTKWLLAAGLCIMTTDYWQTTLASLS